MTRENVLLELTLIGKEVFSDNSLSLDYSSNTGTVEKWDSMTNLIFVDKIEKKYNFKFSLSEILRARNIGDLCDMTLEKLNKDGNR